MAYTKIHAIKATLPKSIKHITNPDKTDGQTLISAFACGAETAAFNFQYALSKTKESDPNKSFHCKNSYWRIRNLSNELCTEHGLSVISPCGERGKNYKEWPAGKQNGS